jgi:DNA-binding MarR family transcriptional regulator
MRGDIVRKHGFSGFACVIRRLSERIDRDLREVYRSHDVYFDPAWYPVVIALHEFGPLSLNEIGDCTGMGAASISNVRARMVAEGLVETTQDPRDLRRQRLHLTGKGKDLIRDLEALWAAIGKASQSLCVETAPDLLSVLEVLEMALARRRIPARVKTLLERRDVQ